MWKQSSLSRPLQADDWSRLQFWQIPGIATILKSKYNQHNFVDLEK